MGEEVIEHFTGSHFLYPQCNSNKHSTLSECTVFGLPRLAMKLLKLMRNSSIPINFAKSRCKALVRLQVYKITYALRSRVCLARILKGPRVMSDVFSNLNFNSFYFPVKFFSSLSISLSSEVPLCWNALLKGLFFTTTHVEKKIYFHEIQYDFSLPIVLSLSFVINLKCQSSSNYALIWRQRNVYFYPNSNKTMTFINSYIQNVPSINSYTTTIPASIYLFSRSYILEYYNLCTESFGTLPDIY